MALFRHLTLPLKARVVTPQARPCYTRHHPWTLRHASARSRNKLDVERDRDAASLPTADTNLTHFPER